MKIIAKEVTIFHKYFTIFVTNRQISQLMERNGKVQLPKPN
jgi:hypothetical protein